MPVMPDIEFSFAKSLFIAARCQSHIAASLPCQFRLSGFADLFLNFDRLSRGRDMPLSLHPGSYQSCQYRMPTSGFFSIENAFISGNRDHWSGSDPAIVRAVSGQKAVVNSAQKEKYFPARIFTVQPFLLHCTKMRRLSFPGKKAHGNEASKARRKLSQGPEFI